MAAVSLPSLSADPLVTALIKKTSSWSWTSVVGTVFGSLGAVAVLVNSSVSQAISSMTEEEELWVASALAVAAFAALAVFACTERNVASATDVKALIGKISSFDAMVMKQLDRLDAMLQRYEALAKAMNAGEASLRQTVTEIDAAGHSVEKAAEESEGAVASLRTAIPGFDTEITADEKGAAAVVSRLNDLYKSLNNIILRLNEATRVAKAATEALHKSEAEAEHVAVHISEEASAADTHATHAGAVFDKMAQTAMQAKIESLTKALQEMTARQAQLLKALQQTEGKA